MFVAVFTLIYGIYSIGKSWFGPVHAEAAISQDPRILPLYSLYSLVRILVAYAISLVFALAYGYVAARSRRSASACLSACWASANRAVARYRLPKKI